MKRLTAGCKSDKTSLKRLYLTSARSRVVARAAGVAAAGVYGGGGGTQMYEVESSFNLDASMISPLFYRLSMAEVLTSPSLLTGNVRMSCRGGSAGVEGKERHPMAAAAG
jgi:hypothetical protein